MSGGYFDGDEYKIKATCEDIARENEFKKDLPKFAKLLNSIGDILYSIIKDYDYHISGDTYIKDLKSFEKKSIERIKSILKEL